MRAALARPGPGAAERDPRAAPRSVSTALDTVPTAANGGTGGLVDRARPSRSLIPSVGAPPPRRVAARLRRLRLLRRRLRVPGAAHAAVDRGALRAGRHHAA